MNRRGRGERGGWFTDSDVCGKSVHPPCCFVPKGHRENSPAF